MEKNNTIAIEFERERIYWIDYIKIIACLMVLVGHFWDTFYRFCLNSPNLSPISINIFTYFPKPFLDGNFWVCVFCILSGYLTAKKKILSFKQLIKEFFMRYVRFFIPLLLANIFVYLIFILVGYSNLEFSHIYGNDWLATFYKSFSIPMLIKNSLFLGSQLNGPLWMIRPLFIGNLLIMVFNYITNKLNLKKEKHLVVIAIILVILLFLSSQFTNTLYILVTFIGSLVVFLSNNIKRKYGILFLIVSIIIISALCYIPSISTVLSIGKVSLSNMLLSFFFIIALFLCNDLYKLKESKLKLSNMSFWIYLIHWPIICSLSCLMVLKITNYTIGFWLTFFVTVILVVILSFILSRIVDKYINLLTIFLKKRIDYILGIKR